MLRHSTEHGGAKSHKMHIETSSEGHKRDSKAPRRRSSALRFFAANPQPKDERQAHSQKDWEAEYLKSLRTHRPARPGGSRPLPVHNASSEPYTRAASALSFRTSQHTQSQDVAKPVEQERAKSALSKRSTESASPEHDIGRCPNGRTLAQPSHKRGSTRDLSAATATAAIPNVSTQKPPVEYRENGMRWMERQEARSLREALADMDMRAEAKVHSAAQDEASNLVWNHMNHGVQGMDAKPFRNYKRHLEEGSHARSQSQGRYAGQNDLDGTVAYSPTSMPSAATSSSASGHLTDAAHSQDTEGEYQHNELKGGSWKPNTHVRWDSPEKKAYTDLAFQIPNVKSGRRRSSGIRHRSSSGGPFKNPDDMIYEETDEGKRIRSPSNPRATKIPAPLTGKVQNSALNVQNTKQPSLPTTKVLRDTSNRLYRSEIYRNPPSRSRDPSYVKNDNSQASKDIHGALQEDHTPERPGTRDGVEIRGDDIRAATSMRLKDRSPRLPSPAFVSGQPGRHIVSFDKDWKPKEQREAGECEVAQERSRSRFKPPLPASTASAPIVPTIAAPDAPSIAIDAPPDEKPMPTISVSDATITTISLPDDQPKPRPLPKKDDHPPAKRPLPHHSSTTPVHATRNHWSPAGHRGRAQCAACALPIAGRIVSAASQRFHPHCFTCHHCAEPLECVAFYPEPDNKRTERLARIGDRMDGVELSEDKPGETAADDGDESLRFYCHLDYHEMFSPRCRSCKTPIETEVILACGGSWHVGHFFCAECGDPFDAKTPFVEKDGYAWCVGCHAGRFSGKCKGCRKPVVEQGVSALGAEWHEKCFVCVVRYDL